MRVLLCKVVYRPEAPWWEGLVPDKQSEPPR